MADKGNDKSEFIEYPDQDVYQEYYDKIFLTEAEEGELINKYSQLESSIKV